jgi:tetratricopeptide (TPR) repeat protein
MSTKHSKSSRHGPPAGEGAAVDWLAVAGLHRFWARAHRTDREPWPQQSEIKRLADRHAGFADWLASHGGAASLAAALQEAWGQFHAGDFARAIAMGQDLGPLGAVVANRAAAVDTLYSRHSHAQILKILETAAARGERAVQLLEHHANAHYMLALVLGRYSQRISILNALAQGLGGRIRTHLERVLALEPRHAEAHLALGLYHAEIVGKLGSIAAGLTYGASPSAAVEHFQRALKLAPTAPIVLIEYAHGLLLLDKDGNRQQARSLYQRAAECEPLDAMEHLDVARARAGLE